MEALTEERCDETCVTKAGCGQRGSQKKQIWREGKRGLVLDGVSLKSAGVGSCLGRRCAPGFWV